MGITSQQINWVAGILEGEGCFYSRKIKSRSKVPNKPVSSTPCIKIGMADEDVIAKLAKLFSCSYTKRVHRYRIAKPLYTIDLYGSRAMGWMMTIYSLMGNRRKGKIMEELSYWRTNGRIKKEARRALCYPATGLV